MAHLLFKDVNKVYPNGYHAVHDFNMEIKDGEFICLVGDSGCGKSTTLRMIAGLEEITAGEFYIDGKLANLMTSRERVQKTAAILGLTPYLDRFPRNLSGGQCQRVAVGRALIRKVSIFLMDEPLSNLDAKQRVTMRSEIKQIHRSVGATTIYVTHDQTEAMTMSDRIVVMKSGGYVQQIGTPYELYFHPDNLFVAGFIGEPPMNFLKGRIEDGKFVNDSVSLDVSPVVDDVAAIEGKEVVFAFRPEAIKVSKTGRAGKEEYLIKSVVDLTELLGDTTNVYANVGDVNVILKVNPHDTPEMGAEFKFVVPYKAAYLFDKETEKAIPSSINRN